MNDRLRRKAGRRSRVMALMSYLGILCLVPLVFNRDDEYVSFHARQGVALWIWGVLAILGLYVPGIGHMFFNFSILAITFLSLMGMVAVIFDRAWRLPFVYNLAMKL
ncbi:MAG: hypothetical protein HQL73_10085 [Magnetococcales bacterium]|nr:hypothetical protein [Magnetococcales bacterium]